jgi:hypothetical protein
MTLEDLSDLPDRMKDLPRNWQRWFRLADEGQLYRGLASTCKEFYEPLMDDEFKETYCKVIHAKRKNRIVAMHYVVDELLSSMYHTNLGAINAIGRTWEINTKAEQAAVLAAPFILTDKELDAIEAFEKKYGNGDYATPIAREYQESFRTSIPSPKEAAHLFSDPRLAQQADLYTSPHLWNKGLHVVLKDRLKKPKHEVWLNSYYAKHLDKNHNVLGIQLREKTAESLARRLAKVATEGQVLDKVRSTYKTHKKMTLQELVSKKKKLLLTPQLVRQFQFYAQHLGFADPYTIGKKDAASKKLWISSFERADFEDITGIQFTTRDLFAGEKVPEHSTVNFLLKSIDRSPGVYSERKIIGTPKNAVWNIYGRFVRPADNHIPNVLFPHEEVVPFREIKYKWTGPEKIKRIWDGQLGSSLHIKTLKDELLYLMGVYRHNKYKMLSDPRNDPVIKDNESLYDNYIAMYKLALPDRRNLTL